MDYYNKTNNVPKSYFFINTMLSYFPDINSIFGIFFYTFILYILGVLVKIIFAKPFNYYEDNEEDNNNTKYDEDFQKRLEEKRKQKAKEAEKLLNKIK